MYYTQKRTKEEFVKQVLWSVAVVIAVRVVVHVICTSCSDSE